MKRVLVISIIAVVLIGFSILIVNMFWRSENGLSGKSLVDLQKKQGVSAPAQQEVFQDYPELNWDKIPAGFSLYYGEVVSYDAGTMRVGVKTVGMKNDTTKESSSLPVVQKVVTFDVSKAKISDDIKPGNTVAITALKPIVNDGQIVMVSEVRRAYDSMEEAARAKQ